jgi:uncharacterized membrane protein
MYGYGHHAHHPVFGIFLLVLLVALLVLAIIALVRFWRTRPGHTSPVPPGTPQGQAVDPALTELRIGYARGEMTSDEYLQRASHLGYQRPPGSSPGGQPPEAQTPPPVA